jgi:hypothetical protein
MEIGRLHIDTALRLWPRFYFARTDGGFVLHLWRVCVTRNASFEQTVREAISREIADFLPDYPDGGRTLDACVDRVMAVLSSTR